jgi:hypothetical protein
MGVKPLSLEALAQQVLGEGRVAHPILAQRLLREAVGEGWQSSDPEGVARTLLPSIRELFRSGLDVDVGLRTSRARRVVEVAWAYHRRLREQGLIDPAEALWEAARSLPSRRSVLVRGYPRLGPAEVAFVDAVAGEGSVIHLPYREASLFAENLEAAKALQRHGWTVEHTPLGEGWQVEAPFKAYVYPHLDGEVRGTWLR